MSAGLPGGIGMRAKEPMATQGGITAGRTSPVTLSNELINGLVDSQQIYMTVFPAPGMTLAVSGVSLNPYRVASSTWRVLVVKWSGPWVWLRLLDLSSGEIVKVRADAAQCLK